MSRLPLLLALALLQAFLAGNARGQTFYFSDGRKASMPEAHIKGSDIVVPLKLAGNDEGSAEIALPISTLARIDWPAPPAIAEAEVSLKTGKPAEALRKIDAILGDQEPFRLIPGSWWNQAAVVKAIALARLEKDVDADVMLEHLRQSKADPADISRAELAIVDQMVFDGKIQTATGRLDKIQETAVDDDSLATIAVIHGLLAERAGDAEAGLRFFLRVPVFYPSADEQMPAALSGAARSYRKLGDKDRADAALAVLVARYPRSPEIAKAKL